MRKPAKGAAESLTVKTPKASIQVVGGRAGEGPPADCHRSLMQPTRLPRNRLSDFPKFRDIPRNPEQSHAGTMPPREGLRPGSTTGKVSMKNGSQEWPYAGFRLIPLVSDKVLIINGRLKTFPQNQPWTMHAAPGLGQGQRGPR